MPFDHLYQYQLWEDLVQHPRADPQIRMLPSQFRPLTLCPFPGLHVVGDETTWNSDLGPDELGEDVPAVTSHCGAEHWWTVAPVRVLGATAAFGHVAVTSGGDEDSGEVVVAGCRYLPYGAYCVEEGGDEDGGHVVTSSGESLALAGGDEDGGSLFAGEGWSLNASGGDEDGGALTTYKANRVQTAQGGHVLVGDPYTIAFPADVRAGSLLTAYVNILNATQTVTVTDSLGQTWTQVGGYVAVGTARVAMFQQPDTLGGACTVTFTVSGGAAVAWSVQEYSGLATVAPLLGQSGGAVTTGTVLTLGPVAVVNPNHSAIGFVAYSGTGTTGSVDAPFSAWVNTFSGSGFHWLTADDLGADGTTAVTYHTAAARTFGGIVAVYANA